MKLDNPINPEWEKMFGHLNKRGTALRCNPLINHAYLNAILAITTLNTLVQSQCDEWNNEQLESDDEAF